MHAVAHVCEMQGRVADGIQWMNETRRAWEANNGLAVHNHWHLALMHLARGEHAAALALYDQAVTPSPLLGRMTSTMRWLILLPAGPGALIGGWLGEHAGLRAALVFAGATALVLSFVAWRQPIIRSTRALPKLQEEAPGIGPRAHSASAA